MTSPNMHTVRFYNPDWLSDEDLKAGFVARGALFDQLRDDLRRTPLQGTAQHYLLVGVRGSGKTSLLKRLAVAIREEDDLGDHLIALSYPEELYEVKDLADFWLASCHALEEALDQSGQYKDADDLAEQLETATSKGFDNLHDDTWLRLLKAFCSRLERRPVLLVDNLDLVLRRIAKEGRKTNVANPPAYWALREALSIEDAPVLIGGSVRLSEPFTDHDKAFYDFFVPHRLGKLSLEDVQLIFDHLAEVHGDSGVKERIRKQPGRVRALYDMTGGNPRALNLIFELLRQGPGSRAVDDFERLMDLTTPYYKARFDDLADQAQVVMHALALAKRNYTEHGFGHTAAEIAAQTGLDTRKVSAQLELLVDQGVVEKSTAEKGRVQYRVAEQLFRLWLQMRSTRRVRQQVVGLAEFLEALYDQEEIEAILQAELANARPGSHHGRAMLYMMVRDSLSRPGDNRFVQSCAASEVLRGGRHGGPSFDESFARGDLSPDVHALFECKKALAGCLPRLRRLRPDAPALVQALLGALCLPMAEKQASVERLADRTTARDELERVLPLLEAERRNLLREGLTDEDVDLFYELRSQGRLSLEHIEPEALELKVDKDPESPLLLLVWKLLGACRIPLPTEDIARAWLDWGKARWPEAPCSQWAAITRSMRRAKWFALAEEALNIAFSRGDCARAWYERGALIYDDPARYEEAETAYRQAMELDPSDAWSWNGLGILLSDDPARYDEAEAAYRKAMELDPTDADYWNNLGYLLADDPARHDEAEAAYRKAIELDPTYAAPWNNLGNLLSDDPARHEEAEAVYRRSLEFDPTFAVAWNNLGILLAGVPARIEEAEAAYHKAIELDPTFASPWNNLGILLADDPTRHDEAEAAYRKAMELDPTYASPWIMLGNLLFNDTTRRDEVEVAYRKAMELDPTYALPWYNLGILLAKDPASRDEAEDAYRQAIKLDPTNFGARFRLSQLQWQRLLAPCKDAVANADWTTAREALAELTSDGRDFQEWLVRDEFVEDIVRVALLAGNGAQLLEIMRDLGFEKIAAPLLYALDAAIKGNADKLAAIEPEAREASQRLFQRLTAPAEPEE